MKSTDHARPSAHHGPSVNAPLDSSANRPPRIIIVGGGAAGFFAAITCAEARPDADITILEKSSAFLGKVRISGGGRCNVTHACFDPRTLATFYPRGERALRAPFQAFQPRDTMDWFERRGVPLKTQDDGCVFPVSDASETIIECLLLAARAAGVKLRLNAAVDDITRRPEGGFTIALAYGENLICDRLLLATGGCRVAAQGELPVALGHTLEAPVPSLFTFTVETPWLRELAGVVIDPVEATVPGAGLRERGILLLTHWGVSGPVILRLSAWGARKLHALHYQFPLHLNWLPQLTPEAIAAQCQIRRRDQPARRIINTPIPPLTARLWEALVLAAGISRDTRWAVLTRAGHHQLIQQLIRTELPVTGQSLNKEEFVTCGGVPLQEVDFKTMASRVCPGLYLAGELLDIDGLTGGYNFQAAWTTGWLAGKAMAGKS